LARFGNILCQSLIIFLYKLNSVAELIFNNSPEAPLEGQKYNFLKTQYIVGKTVSS
ncbi:hypothetical protein ACJX0J_031022, partial [Zea mays]